jgi:hypothetical protein
MRGVGVNPLQGSLAGFTDGDCLWDLSLGRTGDGKIDGETFWGRLWMVFLVRSGGGGREGVRTRQKGRVSLDDVRF